ncbi:hypothetical protein [Chitiniphilus eburneus]|uniref:Uncharacterized protein n=1 Tax=Chitiniphilus eburneus TaxID=2571148 RepID=A0A4U0PX67_9NEIS|nr:hypothetical protein [Chitiniphilus eburneus]TJZ73173.1 hypothetical protein FAZ21_11180 [Chitiniphilus eburneus]
MEKRLPSQQLRDAKQAAEADEHQPRGGLTMAPDLQLPRPELLMVRLFDGGNHDVFDRMLADWKIRDWRMRCTDNIGRHYEASKFAVVNDPCYDGAHAGAEQT